MGQSVADVKLLFRMHKHHWGTGASRVTFLRNESRYSISSLSPKSIFLGDFNEKQGREDIFKPTVRNYILHEKSNVNVVTVVKLSTSKYLIVEMKMFPHTKIHVYTWTLLDGKTQNEMKCFLMDSRWHSSRYTWSMEFRRSWLWCLNR